MPGWIFDGKKILSSEGLNQKGDFEPYEGFQKPQLNMSEAVNFYDCSVIEDAYLHTHVIITAYNNYMR